MLLTLVLKSLQKQKNIEALICIKFSFKKHGLLLPPADGQNRFDGFQCNVFWLGFLFDPFTYLFLCYVFMLILDESIIIVD